MSASLPRQRAPEAAAAELLARTLAAAAGTLPVRAIEALAALVVNRARLAAAGEPARTRFAPGALASDWLSLLAPVCRAPFLFACWNPRDARHALIASPAAGPALAMCRRIAARAAAGGLPDPTGGATHWHDARGLPAWAIGQVAVAEIGGLLFYRIG